MQPGTPGGLLAWARRRPRLTAFVLYAVMSVIFFAPGLLPGHTTSASDYLWSVAPWNNQVPRGVPQASEHPPIYGTNPELVDPVTVFEPFLQYTRSQLPHIPLWDPYIMGGTPYLADMQSAVFSPFSVPAYVLPFWWSLSVIAVLKLLVAAFGTFLLARALRMRFAAAFLSGTVFGFGLFLVAWLPWPLANVFPLIPWLLLATEHLVRRPGPLSGAGLATVVALQFFGGHPESSFDALVATIAFFVLRVLQKGGGAALEKMKEAARAGAGRLRALGAGLLRPVSAFVLALALGAALAAVVILPFVEFLHNSNDLSLRPRTAVYVQPMYYFAALLPGYFPKAFEIETAFYAGALPLMLAVVAMLRAKVERIAVAAFSAVCLLVVLGIQPFFTLIAHAPGFNATYNSRLTILYLLGVALLAGWGLDELLHSRPGRAGRRVVAAIALALVVLPVIVLAVGHGSSLRFLGHSIAVALGIRHYPNPNRTNAVPVIRLAGLVVWLIVSVAAAGLLYARMRGGRTLASATFGVLAVLLVAGDLFQAGMGENPAIPDSHAEQPVTAAIRYLESQRPARFAAVNPMVGEVPLPPDVNLRYGLYDARGYDYPVETRFADLWNSYVAPPTPLLSLDTPAVPILFPVSLRVLNLLGVRDILEQAGQPPLTFSGLHVVYRGRDATIYQNDNALPRTWLVSAQQVVPSASRQMQDVVSSGFDGRDVVITAKRLPGLPVRPSNGSSSGSSAGASPGQARILHYGAQKVVIEADAQVRSELVLSDTYYPGWRVSVDGKAAPIDEVDYMFRGVPLSPGTHSIVFTYDPSSFRTGWITSLASVVVLCVAVAYGVRRRRIATPAT